ncbi:carbohydrate esterase family 4 protein [Plicaturopsis crispa FD-325 SS-3]|nr:carbohydrate esterase family 4 protein [Plicaturopsis crispa FD-325 SS-3]
MFPTFALALPLLAAAGSVPHKAHTHAHAARGSILPGTWYQPRDHPAHALFKRDGSGNGDGVTYAAVGSPEWSAAYPQALDPSKYPQAWVDALNAAVASGKIPDIPVSSSTDGATPVYPNGLDSTSPQICSSSAQCRNMTYDTWDAPDGKIGIGFDDGPLPPSKTLYDFLVANNQKATHFMIGSNILWNSDAFNQAFNQMQDDIAVHTWTHPLMTTLNNSMVLGELGWTMEIIHNSTGGRLPKYWRPPYGDADNRVRAIAKEVFGLDTIIWNQDTDDWSLTTGGQTMQAINSSMQGWLTGPKSPGLIILEHELSNQSVQAFIDAYPVMKQNGWQLESCASMLGKGTWLNAASNTGSVTPAGVLDGNNVSSSASASSSAPASKSSGTSTSSGAASSSSSSSNKAASSGNSTSDSSSSSGAARWEHSSSAIYGALVLAAATLLV